MTRSKKRGPGPARRAAADERLHAALAHHRAGRHRDAEALYRQILQSSPADVDANNLLGMLCIQTGRPEKAIGLIRRALATQPDNARSIYNLAMALKDLGRLSEAGAELRRAAELEPGNAETHNSLGNIQLALAQSARAVASFERALRLQPRYSQAHCNLANALRKAGHLAAAADRYREAVRLDPALVPAHIGLGETLVRLGHAEEAMDSLDRAVRLAPKLADAHNAAGVALNAQDRVVEAIAKFEDALRCDARHRNALVNLGVTLGQAGRLDEARRTLQTLVASHPGFADGYFHLAWLRNHTPAQSEIDAMRALIDRADIPPGQRVLLAYALGMACEKNRRESEAFAWFETAHRLAGEGSSFDLEDQARYIDAIITIFDHGLFTRLAGQGNTDARPIFVVGMPRSGTTLTEQILASHPQVHGAGERNFLPAAAREARTFTGRPYPLGFDTLSAENFNELATHYLARLGRLSDAGRIVDTTPMNFVYIGLIAAMLPNARIVHCRRSPMDTCLSIYMHPLTEAHAYAHDLKDLGGYYRLYRRLMRHWHEVLPGRIHDIRYEDLVADSEGQIRALLDHCGLPFDPACLEFHGADRVVRSPSAGHVRQPIYGDSVRRWKRYEDELAPLKAILQ